MNARLSALAALTVLLASTFALGCSGGDADLDDDGEADGETEITADALRTEGLTIPGDNKVCAKVKRTTPLFYSTKGGTKITSDLGSSVNAGRFVLVQRRPGTVNDRVWADPDLSGLTASSDNAAVAERCGISREAAQRARVRAKENRYGRRGWIDVSDLEFASRTAGGPALSRGLPENTSKQVKAVLHSVRGCTSDATYHGSTTERGTGMASYADIAGNGLYVLLGTPEIDGGGMTFRYLPHGADWNEVASHRHSGKNGHGQLSGEPVFWSEGWFKQDGATIRGFVLRNCLE